MSETFPDEDRCSDLIDQASQTESRMRENDVALARAKAAPEQVQEKDKYGVLYWPVTECVDCDNEIPAGRLALAKVRCIICQGAKEKRDKQRA